MIEASLLEIMLPHLTMQMYTHHKGSPTGHIFKCTPIMQSGHILYIAQIHTPNCPKVGPKMV